MLRRRNNPLIHARAKCNFARRLEWATRSHNWIIPFSYTTSRIYKAIWYCANLHTRRDAGGTGWRRNQTTFPIKRENVGISLFLRLKKAELQCRRHERDSFLFVSPFQMCARPKKRPWIGTRTQPFIFCPSSLLALFSRPPPPPLSFCRTRYALTSHEHITSLLFYFSTAMIQEQKS